MFIQLRIFKNSYDYLILFYVFLKYLAQNNIRVVWYLVWMYVYVGIYHW